MSAKLEESHGRLRPTTPRIGAKKGSLRSELPEGRGTAVADTDRDAATGRFIKANGAARRRTLKRLAKALPGLDPSRCSSWLAPFARAAAEHAVELTAGLGPKQSATLNALAGDAAAALGVARGLLALGAAGDMDALKEARAWMREHRSLVVTLEALAREAASSNEGEVDLSHFTAKESTP